MAFRTKIDYSTNRQIRQTEKTSTLLSGSTTFGLPFSGLSTGPNLDTVVVLEDLGSITGTTFSGNLTTTIFTFTDPRLELGASTLSAITSANSGVTQDTGDVLTGFTTTVIDGNTVTTSYTGITYTMDVVSIADLGGSTFSGTAEHDSVFTISAGTADYTGRTIWIDNPEITRTDRLIISRGAISGYTLTCDSEGMVSWTAPTTGGTITAPSDGVWISGSTLYSIKAINNTTTNATSAYAVAMGADTLASGASSLAVGSGTTAGAKMAFASGYNTQVKEDYGFSSGEWTLAKGFAAFAGGSGTTAHGYASVALGADTGSSGVTSVSLGRNTIALGNHSLALGRFTRANGPNSFASGLGVSTSEYVYSDGIGSFTHFGLTGNLATISGVGGSWSAILGGQDHFIDDSSDNSVILGGTGNTMNESSSSSIIIGGYGNVVVSGSTNVGIINGIGISGSTSNTVYVPDLVIDGLTSVTDLQTNANGLVIDGTSDIRLKENITDLESALDKVKQLRGVSFTWKEESEMGPGTQFGMIAQEVQQVIPDMVKSKSRNKDLLSLDYKALVPWLVEAIKELSTPSSPIFNEIRVSAETVTSEDNNIQLNFNGTNESSVGGGIIVINGIDENTDAQLVLNTDGYWATNNYLKPGGLIIPEYTPTSASDLSGVNGEITRDNDNLYIKGNDGVWKKCELKNIL